MENKEASTTGGNKPASLMDKRRSSSLDEAMEQIFHPSSHRFSFADLGTSAGVGVNQPRFKESDYKSHRRESLHHHQPLHKIYHRHKRPSHKSEQDSEAEQGSSSKIEEPSSDGRSSEEQTPKVQDRETIPAEGKVMFYVGSSTSIETPNVVPSPKRSFSNKLSSSLHTMKNVLLRQGPKAKDSLSTPMSPSLTMPCTSAIPESTVLDDDVNQQSSSFPTVPRNAQKSSISEKHKVKFSLADGIKEQETIIDEKIKEKKSKFQKNPKRHFSHDAARRQHPGSRLEVKSYNEVLEPEEAKLLTTSYIEDVASHRFDNVKAIRRHKISDKSSVSSFLNLRKKDVPDSNGFSSPKKFDHQPHEVNLHYLLLNRCRIERYPLKGI